MRLKLLVITSIFTLIGIANAETFTCGSGSNSCTGDSACTASNLSTCISNASDGDTINIASGSYTWQSSLPITVDKRITISGQGYCGSSADDDSGSDCGDVRAPSGTWSVTIDNNSSDIPIFEIEVTSAGSDIVRISGIDFTGRVVSNYDQYCHSSNHGGYVDESKSNIGEYRIDNNRFRTSSTNYMHCNITLCSHTYGLVDHNYFYTTGSATLKSIWLERALPTDQYQDSQDGWLDPVDFGSENFVFIEDNSVNHATGELGMGPMFVDSANGARFVIRYNYIYNAFSEFHGFSGGGWSTPGYATEIYNNTFGNSANCYRTWWFRGGTGLYHNNTVTGTWHNAVVQFGDTSNGRPAGNSRYNGWGSDWDGNCQDGGSGNNTNVTTENGFNYNCTAAGNPYPTGYPTFGLPGWGQINSATHTDHQPQSYSPIRIWSNSIGRLTPHNVTESDSNMISLNRDVFYSTDDSAAPSGYRAYTYPHPLQGTSEGHSSLAAPANLRIADNY